MFCVPNLVVQPAAHRTEDRDMASFKSELSKFLFKI